jgi:hypothetical protein
LAWQQSDAEPSQFWASQSISIFSEIWKFISKTSKEGFWALHFRGSVNRRSTQNKYHEFHFSPEHLSARRVYLINSKYSQLVPFHTYIYITFFSHMTFFFFLVEKRQRTYE